jgi:farnesyl diphosphate synthase
MAIVQRLGETTSLVERRLSELIGTYGPGEGTRLGAALRHALLAGGKRFRPFLVIESGALFGLSAAQTTTAAAAIECIHCYSLVHDDLPSMDNDDMRRGRPTVHKAYDEWTAILVGDALLTMAFEILADSRTHPDARVRAALVAEVAGSAGARGMVQGQMLDLAAEKRGEPAEPTVAQVRELQRLKTGALIACACEAGAILAEASESERVAMRAFGEQLGLAFQIADDLLDAEGDEATVGKATRKDSSVGKATLIRLLGVAKARTLLAETQSKAIAALAPFGSRAEGLIEAARFAATRAH